MNFLAASNCKRLKPKLIVIDDTSKIHADTQHRI